MRLLLLTIFTLAATILPAGSALGDAGIMPLSEVQAGMDCTGESVIQGTTISSFGVHVIGIVQAPGAWGTSILVSVSGPAVDRTGVVAGFSGSPVYCPDPSGAMLNAGAISAGIGEYGNKVALVTPIEQMLGEPVKPPSGAPRLRARIRPLLGPLTIGGLSPSLFGLLERAARRAGREVVAAPTGVAGGYPVQQLVPGAAVGVQYSVGTITSGAIGTVTYTSGRTVYAFGHELDGAGRRSLMLSDAYVYYVVADPNPADLLGGGYKLAAPGHLLGTLTSDTPAAVIGEVGAPPSLIPIQVTAHDLDRGQTTFEQTQVADENGVGQPLGSSSLDGVAPLAVGQAAIDVYNGAPAAESGRMCLRIFIRGSAQPLGFCKRYVGIGISGGFAFMPPEVANGASNDVARALGVIDAAQFAALPVTKVQATIEAQRGLSEASIVSASATRARRGGRALVRLRARMFRGAIRTVSFRMRVPRSAHGAVLVSIKGPAFAPSPAAGEGGPPSALISLLTSSLGGPFGPSAPPPSSLEAVRRQIHAIGGYDGLTASFDGGKRVRVYTDPKLLLSGRTTLLLQAA